MPKRELNPTLTRYTRETIPPLISQQITDFVRIFWFEPYLYGLTSNMGEREIAWAMVEGDVLYSHAAVVFAPITCNGIEYASGGLSAVLTYTWFRNLGYGRACVNACNAEIDASEIDVAILWTSEDKIPFYTHCGWEHAPDANTVKGDPAAPEHHEGVVMLRFVTEKARAARADLLTQPIYIGKHGW